MFFAIKIINVISMVTTFQIFLCSFSTFPIVDHIIVAVICFIETVHDIVFITVFLACIACSHSTAAICC